MVRLRSINLCLGEGWGCAYRAAFFKAFCRAKNKAKKMHPTRRMVPMHNVWLLALIMAHPRLGLTKVLDTNLQDGKETSQRTR